jgi:hypothetical protein
MANAEIKCDYQNMRDSFIIPSIDAECAEKNNRMTDENLFKSCIDEKRDEQTPIKNVEAKFRRFSLKCHPDRYPELTDEQKKPYDVIFAQIRNDLEIIRNWSNDSGPGPEPPLQNVVLTFFIMIALIYFFDFDDKLTNSELIRFLLIVGFLMLCAFDLLYIKSIKDSKYGNIYASFRLVVNKIADVYIIYRICKAIYNSLRRTSNRISNRISKPKKGGNRKYRYKYHKYKSAYNKFI